MLNHKHAYRPRYYFRWQYEKAYRHMQIIISELEEELSADKLEKIKQCPIGQLNRFHFGLNMYLRNKYIHGNDKDFCQLIQPNFVSYYGEIGEGIITEHLWRRLNNRELSLDTQFLLFKLLPKLGGYQDMRPTPKRLSAAKQYIELTIGKSILAEHHQSYLHQYVLYFYIEDKTDKKNGADLSLAKLYIGAVQNGLMAQDIQRLLLQHQKFRDMDPKPKSTAYEEYQIARRKLWPCTLYPIFMLNSNIQFWKYRRSLRMRIKKLICKWRGNGQELQQ